MTGAPLQDGTFDMGTGRFVVRFLVLILHIYLLYLFVSRRLATAELVGSGRTKCACCQEATTWIECMRVKDWAHRKCQSVEIAGQATAVKSSRQVAPPRVGCGG